MREEKVGLEEKPGRSQEEVGVVGVHVGTKGDEQRPS